MPQEPTIDEFIDDPDQLADALGGVDEARVVPVLDDPELGEIVEDTTEIVDERFLPDHVTRPAEEVAMHVEPDH